MAIPTILPCDGCGQLASPEHFSRRLQRLEWATRFRPIHIQALLLTAAAPESAGEFLYNPETRFAGLSGQILTALDLHREGKCFEEVLTEFQKRGVVLVSALECPVEPSPDAAMLNDLLERHLPSAIARIRRSLKPKRVLVLSPELQPLLTNLNESSLGCSVLYTPLHLSAVPQTQQTAELADFRAALLTLAAHGN
jgi:hypothetical protein